MKNSIYLIAILVLTSCSCKKTTSQKLTAALESDCPKDGTCTVEIIDNKKLNVKQDEFGSIYYELEDSFDTKVVKYKYSRTVKGNLQDAGYREEIVFEIENTLKDVTLSDSDIQNTKMLFGRFCYCKGQTGNYKVSNGKLIFNSKENTIDLDFKVTEVPQIITKIKLSLK